MDSEFPLMITPITIKLVIVIVIGVIVLFLYIISNKKISKMNKKLCIMQTHKWKINEIPPEYIKPINSWKSQNFNYVYYSNIDAYNYLLKHFGKHYADIFDNINIGAYKADFFRYCWIYIEGGIYADTDSLCLIDIEKWLEEYKDVDVILTRDDPTNIRALYQAFIYSKKPYNKLFKACIEIIVDNIDKYRNGESFDEFDFTGPGLMYNAFCKINPCYLNKNLPIGLINTNCGNMLIMSWNNNYKIIDNYDREIFQHKYEGCIGEGHPDYWTSQINKPWIKN
jgi:hypothetical protein